MILPFFGGESLADFLHGAALGGADVDDEDATWVLFLGGYRERGEFGVEGVDAYGGDGGPFVLLRNFVNALSKMGRFSGWEPHTLIPTANLRMIFGVRPITLIQSNLVLPYRLLRIKDDESGLMAILTSGFCNIRGMRDYTRRHSFIL